MRKDWDQPEKNGCRSFTPFLLYWIMTWCDPLTLKVLHCTVSLIPLPPRVWLTKTELQPLLAPNTAHHLRPLSAPDSQSMTEMKARARPSTLTDASNLHPCCIRLQLSQLWNKNICGLLPQTQQAQKQQRERGNWRFGCRESGRNPILGCHFSISKCCKCFWMLTYRQ